jgi:hypothetical protein
LVEARCCGLEKKRKRTLAKDDSASRSAKSTTWKINFDRSLYRARPCAEEARGKRGRSEREAASKRPRSGVDLHGDPSERDARALNAGCKLS